MKRIASSLLVPAVAALALAGCKASPLAENFDAAARDIKSAKSAGAPTYAPSDFENAEGALDLARETEEAAQRSHQRAEEAIQEAQQDLAALQKLEAERQDALTDAQTRKAGSEAIHAQLQRRQIEMRAKGLSEKEIDNAIGDDLALAQLDATTARSTIKTLEAELELIGQRRQEANRRIAAANERKSVASQELLTARTLCDKAGAAARAAEAHAVAKRKAELKVR